MVSDFNGFIGCWDLNCFRNQGTTFASCAFTHVKVPGWLSNLNAQIFMKSFTLRVIVASNVPVRNESKMIIVYLISYRQFNI